MEYLETKFPGISCGFFDLFRVHILLMWPGWSVTPYSFLFVYDMSKNFISNLPNTSRHPGIQSFFEANQKYHPGSIRVLFAVIIPIFLWMTADILTKSMYLFYDVNKGVFLAIDIVFMFRQYPEISYLIMILVIFCTIYCYDKNYSEGCGIRD